MIPTPDVETLADPWQKVMTPGNQALRQFRRMMGWSLEDVAHRVGKTLLTVHRHETGKTAPSGADVTAMRTALTQSLVTDLVRLGWRARPKMRKPLGLRSVSRAAFARRYADRVRPRAELLASIIMQGGRTMALAADWADLFNLDPAILRDAPAVQTTAGTVLEFSGNRAHWGYAIGCVLQAGLTGHGQLHQSMISGVRLWERRLIHEAVFACEVMWESAWMLPVCTEEEFVAVARRMGKGGTSQSALANAALSIRAEPVA